MSEYRLKGGKIEEAVRAAYKKIENKFVSAFLNEDGSMKVGKMGEAATGAYQKIENAVVGTYKKVEDAFVDAFLEKIEDENETADTDGKETAEK